MIDEFFPCLRSLSLVCPLALLFALSFGSAQLGRFPWVPLSLGRYGPCHSSTRSAGPFLQGPIVQVWRSALSGASAIRHSGIYGRSSSATAALLGALRAQRFAALALDRPSDRCSLRHPACPALGNVWRWLGPHLLELAHGSSGARRSQSLWRLASCC